MESKVSHYDKVQEIVGILRSKGVKNPRIGIVLGSGLGSFAERVQSSTRVPYSELPHWPAAGVEGHTGMLIHGDIGGVEVVCLQGRAHYYEGYSLEEITLPTRVLCMLGIHSYIVTNASGGMNPGFTPGDLMIITDHINLMGVNPLRGVHDERFGPRFPDMTSVYDAEYQEIFIEQSIELGISSVRGIYAAMSGPSYETPAEIRMLRTMGADAVGMSTIPEVMAARQMDVRVAGISCITNAAAGITGRPLSHEEVTEMSKRVGEGFGRLLESVIPQIG
jgi:purine-nucleoside phosphorylase